jgi:TPR repeat protein
MAHSFITRRGPLTSALLLLIAFLANGCSSVGTPSSNATSYADSLRLQQARALEGDTAAATWVAEWGLRRFNRLIDTTNTLSLLRLSAHKGAVRAMVILGDLHVPPAHGNDVAGLPLDDNPLLFRPMDLPIPDSATALYWYRSAARSGYAAGLRGVGRIFLQDLNLPQARDSAFHYLSLAAHQGDARAWLWLASFIETIDPKRVEALLDTVRSEQEAPIVTCVRMAEELGDRDAGVFLGTIHERGLYGAHRSSSTALGYLQEAVRRGSPRAGLLASSYYMRGEGAALAPELGAEYVAHSANLGNVFAQAEMARLYFEGVGVSCDTTMALAWLYRASRNPLADTVGLKVGLQQRMRFGHGVLHMFAGGRVLQLDDDGLYLNSPLPDAGASHATAFVVERHGIAVAAWSAIESAKSIVLDDSAEPISVIAVDSANDIALLRLPHSLNSVPPLRLSDGQVIRPGSAEALGYPDKRIFPLEELRIPVDVSLVVAPDATEPEMKATSNRNRVAIGGPVIDRRGHVLGILVRRIEPFHAGTQQPDMMVKQTAHVTGPTAIRTLLGRAGYAPSIMSVWIGSIERLIGRGGSDPAKSVLRLTLRE